MVEESEEHSTRLVVETEEEARDVGLVALASVPAWDPLREADDSG